MSEGPRYFDVLVKEDTIDQPWRCTFVYGEAKASERHHMWTTLRRIKPNTTEPWLMMGDFNETMWQHEHFSETKRSERRMADFRNVLSFCNLHDMDFSGPTYTFDNKQKGKKMLEQDWSEPLPLTRGLRSSRIPSSLTSAPPAPTTCPCYWN